MIIWRLTTQNVVSDAFNGVGASKFGGRFNSKGTKIIYCAQSVSLALLENLVHFDTDIAPPLYLFEISINDADIFYDPKVLTFLKVEVQTKAHGDSWITKAQSLVLKVPSLIVNSEFNYLINPTHPSFQTLQIKSHGLFRLDQRLVR